MKKLTVKEIMNMEKEDLGKLITDEQWDRVQEIFKDSAGNKLELLLEALQDSARLSGQTEDEEHVSMDEYLDYLEGNY